MNARRVVVVNVRESRVVPVSLSKHAYWRLDGFFMILIDLGGPSCELNFGGAACSAEGSRCCRVGSARVGITI